MAGSLELYVQGSVACTEISGETDCDDFACAVDGDGSFVVV